MEAFIEKLCKAGSLVWPNFPQTIGFSDLVYFLDLTPNSYFSCFRCSSVYFGIGHLRMTRWELEDKAADLVEPYYKAAA